MSSASGRHPKARVPKVLESQAYQTDGKAESK